MKAKQLRELTDDELRERLGDLRGELLTLRHQVVTGQIENPRRIREVRRLCARILTILRERELGIKR
jgi:large subunit ribosomal protein L29